MLASSPVGVWSITPCRAVSNFSCRQENEKGRWDFLRKNLLGEEVGRVGREI